MIKIQVQKMFGFSKMGSLPPSCCAAFLPFLKCAIAEVLPTSPIAQLWPAADASWKWLKLSVSDMGAAPDIFLQKPPLQLSPATKTLPCKPNTSSQTHNKCMTGFLLRNSKGSRLLSQHATLHAWTFSWKLCLSQKSRIFFVCIYRLSCVLLHFSFLYH